MNALTINLESLEKQFSEAISKAQTLDELEECRLTFLSRNGQIAALVLQLKDLPLKEKQHFGPLINNFKQYAHELFETKKNDLQAQRIQQQLGKDRHFDVTAYVPYTRVGTLHPLTHVYHRIFTIFISMGYSIEEGPEAETEYYNFEALNIPKHHPARDVGDTIWLDVPGYLLRTHTSSVQVHALEKQQLPLALVAPGRVYRHEATDATHDFMFNQLEGLMVAENIALSHLLATLKLFFRTLFDKKNLELQVRPDYFPFVEPGLEISVSCPFCKSGCSLCKKTGFIEMGGAGLVHPNILECSNIDPKRYSGFAFGLGVERIAMLLYGITDIRLLASGKVEFLKQFA